MSEKRYVIREDREDVSGDGETIRLFLYDMEWVIPSWGTDASRARSWSKETAERILELLTERDPDRRIGLDELVEEASRV